MKSDVSWKVNKSDVELWNEMLVYPTYLFLLYGNGPNHVALVNLLEFVVLQPYLENREKDIFRI